ncbi:MAG: hypothetical protein ACJ71F_21015, partial [Nitrososphaeraceae archaeon]
MTSMANSNPLTKFRTLDTRFWSRHLKVILETLSAADIMISRIIVTLSTNPHYISFNSYCYFQAT